MYFLLPETENRSLEDIEIHFSDNDRKMTDRKIKKSSKNTATATDSEKPVEQNSVGVENEKQIKQKTGYSNEGFAADS